MQGNPYYDNQQPEVEIGVAGINGNGDAVTVVTSATINGYDTYHAVGVAKRDPLDPRDDEIGIKLAVGRAIRQLGRDILKDGQAGVREADRARRSQRAAVERAQAAKNKRAKALKKKVS